MRKEDFDIDFNEKPRNEGNINKQCSVCNGFRDLSEFKHKKKAGRMDKVCRRCLDRSRRYHIDHLVLMQNRVIAEGNT